MFLSLLSEYGIAERKNSSLKKNQTNPKTNILSQMCFFSLTELFNIRIFIVIKGD